MYHKKNILLKLYLKMENKTILQWFNYPTLEKQSQFILTIWSIILSLLPMNLSIINNLSGGFNDFPLREFPIGKNGPQINRSSWNVVLHIRNIPLNRKSGIWLALKVCLITEIFSLWLHALQTYDTNLSQLIKNRKTLWN